MSRIYSIQEKLAALRPGIEAGGYCLAELEDAEKLAEEAAEKLDNAREARSDFWFVTGNFARGAVMLLLCSGVVTCGLAAATFALGAASHPGAKEDFDFYTKDAEGTLENLENAIENLCGCLNRSFPDQ